MTTTASNPTSSLRLPHSNTVQSSTIHSVVTLVLLAVLVWLPLRLSYPVLLDSGDITVTGVNTMLWLTTAMAAVATVAVGAALSLRKDVRTGRRSPAPMVGCSLAAMLFAVVSVNLPIW